MDFSSQIFAENLNIPVIISKLLLQQKKSQVKAQEKSYSIVPRHLKINSLPCESSFVNENYRNNYRKMKRDLYDHNKSLKHAENSFSINTILMKNREKYNSVKLDKKSKTKDKKFKVNLHEILRKTEKLLEKTHENLQKTENKGPNKIRILSKREKKKSNAVKIEIPMVRAQTIVPSSRKKYNSNMIDQEITTDFNNIFSYLQN